MTFAHPYALLLLAVVPIPFLLARARTGAMPFPGTADLRAAPLLPALPALLRALCLVALVVAIAGPSTPGSVVEERGEGVPIVLAIDVSSSMLAQDFAPRDRISVARATIARFVRARENDPVGVVAFAAEALTLVPATTHRAVVVGAVESLRVGLLEDGTAIGDGLAAAVNRIRHSGASNGVVVLLSDGESNRGSVDPRAAAEAAAATGVRVFTVGIGSDGVARVPVETATAGFRYAELPVAVDEALLRDIARRTGGAYFRATDPAALDRIYAEIDRMVPSVVETTRRVERRPWAAFLLLFAGTALAAEWLLRGSRWGVVP